MNIANEISRSTMAAVKALYGQDVPEAMIQVQKTKREFEGHLTLVVFPPAAHFTQEAGGNGGGHRPLAR